MYMETQNILNSQSNSEQKSQHWRFHNTWLQTILKSYNKRTAWYWHSNRD
jgi:hypothetical protein